MTTQPATTTGSAAAYRAIHWVSSRCSDQALSSTSSWH